MRSRTRDAAVPSAELALHLVVVDGNRLVTTPLPAAGTVVIGRGEHCEVQLDDPSVSRHHARLHVGAQLAVEDLGSTNRTFIGDSPIAPNTRRSIAPGEPIRFGSVLASVERRPLPRPSGEAAGAAEPTSGAAMRPVHELVDRVATSMLGVLILGETGVGKEVLAERIHRRSPRADRPFVRLHCAALSESLLESELFGHERGAFTGATSARTGLLASAQSGTVFLDEIGELSPAMQIKLLRVLETREVVPVGGDRPRAIDVRFLAATNRDLEAEVARGAFRQDLYFRLDGITIVVPPLRERRDEIEPLANGFVAITCRDANRPAKRLAPDTLDVLRAHHWPGNVRELRNVVERAVLISAGDVIEPEHVVLGRSSNARADDRDAARRRIIEVLDQCGGNQTRAARLLGIGRRTLLHRLDELGLPRPRKAVG